jgi:hypothetical protein
VPQPPPVVPFASRFYRRWLRPAIARTVDKDGIDVFSTASGDLRAT